MNKITEALHEVRSALVEGVYEELDEKHDMYRARAYALGVYDATDELIMSVLRKLVDDPKALAKAVGAVSRKVMAKNKDNERAQKAEYDRNLKLWKISKGAIPCLNKCGYTETRSKDEVLNGSNNFICAKCSTTLKDDTWKVFRENSVFRMFGIIEVTP